jgi:hypothetical protein
VTPIEQIKAGKYELVALSWDEPTSKPGEPYDFKRHVKGDVVNLNVEEARRLYATGAVVLPGEREAAAAAAAIAQAQAALALVPEELRAQLGDIKTPKPEPSVAPGGDTGTAVDLGDFPTGDTAAEDDWVAKAKVSEITTYASEHPDTKAALLAAEQRRGEKARSTVVEALSK